MDFLKPLVIEIRKSHGDEAWNRIVKEVPSPPPTQTNQQKKRFVINKTIDEKQVCQKCRKKIYAMDPKLPFEKTGLYIHKTCKLL